MRHSFFTGGVSSMMEVACFRAAEKMRDSSRCARPPMRSDRLSHGWCEGPSDSAARKVRTEHARRIAVRSQALSRAQPKPVTTDNIHELDDPLLTRNMS